MFVEENTERIQREKDAQIMVVIGNPPYGRVTLAPAVRQRYQRSLYGHANLYGMFTDLAIRLTRPGGVIAYVTPTSFLANVLCLRAASEPPSRAQLVRRERTRVDARHGLLTG